MKTEIIESDDILQNGNEKIDKLKQGSFDLKNALHVYCRVSSVSQIGGTSLEEQKRIGIEFAQKEGFKYCVCWIEKGESGDDISSSKSSIDNESLVVRTLLMRMLILVKEHQIKSLWVSDLSRLTRTEEVAINIKQQFYQNGVVFYNGNVKYDFDNTTDKLMFGVFSVFNEYENNLRFEKSINGKIAKLKNGGWIGGLHTFGYQIGSSGKLEKHPVNQDWVKKIYKWYTNENKSTKWIGDELIKNGVKTSRGNTNWNSASILCILKNTVYTGIMDYEIRGLKGKSKEECEKRGRLYKIRVNTPQIISDKLFSETQKKLSTIRSVVMSRVKTTKNFYMLKEFLVCGICKGNMGGKIIKSKGENIYFCQQKIRKYSNRMTRDCGVTRSINIGVTDDLVWHTVLEVWRNSYKIKEKFKQEFLTDKLGDYKNTKQGILKKQQKLKRVKKELEILNEKSKQLYRDYMVDEVVSKSVYDDVNIEQMNKIKIKESQIKELNNEIEVLQKDFVWYNWMNDFNNEYDTIKKIKDKKRKQEFLKKVLDKVEVYWDNNKKEHTLKLHFKLPIYKDKRIRKEKHTFSIKNGTKSVTINGINSKKMSYKKNDTHLHNYSTVTDLAKFLG